MIPNDGGTRTLRLVSLFSLYYYTVYTVIIYDTAVPPNDNSPNAKSVEIKENSDTRLQASRTNHRPIVKKNFDPNLDIILLIMCRSSTSLPTTRLRSSVGTESLGSRWRRHRCPAGIATAVVPISISISITRIFKAAISSPAALAFATICRDKAHTEEVEREVDTNQHASVMVRACITRSVQLRARQSIHISKGQALVPPQRVCWYPTQSIVAPLYENKTRCNRCSRPSGVTLRALIKTLYQVPGARYFMS